MVSYIKVILAIVAITSYKSIPFAYVYKFYSGYFKYILLQRSKYRKTGRKNTFGYTVAEKGPLALFEPVTYDSYVSPMEYDMFLHKSNSTYFSDMDFARLKLLCLVLQKGFLSYSENEYGDFKKASITNQLFVPVARVECTFKKELKLFERYKIVSRIGAWDDKWLYVLTKFVKSKDKRVVAIGVTKYVFKLGRETVPPKVVFERSELYTKEVEEENEKWLQMLKNYDSTDDLGVLVDKF